MLPYFNHAWLRQQLSRPCLALLLALPRRLHPTSRLHTFPAEQLGPAVQPPHLNSRMPLGEDASNVSRVLLLNTNSAMNLSMGVVTSGTSAHA